MGAKDTKAKEYLSDNERFADLCNAVLFDGGRSSGQRIWKRRIQQKYCLSLGLMKKKSSFKDGEIF